jgi:hypothetical protein
MEIAPYQRSSVSADRTQVALRNEMTKGRSARRGYGETSPWLYRHVNGPAQAWGNNASRGLAYLSSSGPRLGSAKAR